MVTEVPADGPAAPDVPLAFLSELHDRFRADMDDDQLQPPGDRANGPPAGERAPAAAPGRGRRVRRVAGAVGAGLVVALVAGIAVGSSGGGDGGADADTSAPTGATTTTAPVPPPTPSEAFRQASERLQSAGTFTYTGTAHATDVSRARPGLWLAVDVLVTGEVDLRSGRVRETAVVPDGGAAETVTDGPDAWGRSAPEPGALPEEAYRTIPRPSDAVTGPLGAALLPVWLGFAGGAEDAGTDELGRPSFRAILPAEALGEVQAGQGPVAGLIVLSLDEAGEPVRVEVTSLPDGAELRLVLDISGIGEPVVVAPPAPGE